MRRGKSGNIITGTSSLTKSDRLRFDILIYGHYTIDFWDKNWISKHIFEQIEQAKIRLFIVPKSL